MEIYDGIFDKVKLNFFFTKVKIDINNRCRHHI